MTRDMMRDVMETSLKKPIQTGEFRKNPVEPAWRCPGDYIYELVPTEKFVMEYLKPKQAVTGRVVLQLHGGGYIGPMKNIYRRFAVKYSELGLGADVLTRLQMAFKREEIRPGTDRHRGRLRGRRTCPGALPLREGPRPAAPCGHHHHVPVDGCDPQRSVL